MLGKSGGGLLLLGVRRSAPKPHPIQESPKKADAGVLGKFRVVGQVERLHDLYGKIAGGEHLHLALHRLLVQRYDLLVAHWVGFWPGERRFVILDENARFRGEERPHHR